MHADAGVPQAPARVLLVDDNPAKRLALRAVLAPLGYGVVEAESGKAALRCLLAGDFAVILLDVHMPDMGGFETAALIRQRRRSEMTPIIFITAYASDEIDATERYAEGAVDFMFAPVPPDELRAKVAVFAHLFERAERLAAQAREVKASADQLRLLTEAAPVGIFQTDPEDRYVYTNPQWSEITGLSAREALGRDCRSVLGEQPGVPLDSASGVPDLAAERSRFELPRPPLPPRVVQLTRKVIPGAAGGVAGWVGTLADVTAEAGAEAAMVEARDRADEASRQKSDFLANMSHEIRTPMNGVLGMTDLLLETALDDRQRDYAQTVRNSGEALLAILNDILDFSKVEAGKMDIEHVEFDVRRLVQEVLHLLGGQARDRGLDVGARVHPAVPELVVGDPGRVRQVLTNLVGNAVKFTPSGHVRVGVDTAGAAEDAGVVVVRFEVADTGVGIAAEQLTSIFQPFVQADSSTSRRYGGTGLGLAISGQLVALMGGSCGVTSRLGEGSTFWFTVRVGVDPYRTHTAPAPAAAEPLACPGAGGAQGELGRLLLAEDNLINRKVAVAMLTLAGYRVDAVPTGTAAVAAVAAHRYDAILMDCQMPDMDGYAATAAIRAAQQGTGRRTQIIALTAGARHEDRERCLLEGMDSYIAKPVSKDALLAQVARSVRAGRS